MLRNLIAAAIITINVDFDMYCTNYEMEILYRRIKRLAYLVITTENSVVHPYKALSLMFSEVKITTGLQL
jgi:hypothetical protein